MGKAGSRLYLLSNRIGIKDGYLFIHPHKDLWIDHEWGSGVVFYFFAKLFGEGGLFALKAFVLLMIIVIILKIIKYQSGKEPGIMYVLFLALSI